MSREWLYSHNGKEHGPVSTDQLKELAQTGALLPTDTVWTEGITTWRQASKAKGLTFATQPTVAAKDVAPDDALAGDVPAPKSQNEKNIEEFVAYVSPKLQKFKEFAKLIFQPIPEPAKDDALAADVAPMTQNQKNIEQLRAYALPKLQKSKDWFLRQPRWLQCSLALVLLGMIGAMMDHRSSQPWSAEAVIAEGEAALAKLTPAEREKLHEKVHREVRESMQHPPIWSEDKDGEIGHIIKHWNPTTHRYEDANDN
jgi:hypothetical protein